MVSHNEKTDLCYRYFQKGAKAGYSTVQRSEDLVIMQGLQFTQAVNLNELDTPACSFYDSSPHLFHFDIYPEPPRIYLTPLFLLIAQRKLKLPPKASNRAMSFQPQYPWAYMMEMNANNVR